MTHHGRRTAFRWLAGVASVVLAGVIIALLVWIGNTTVTTKVEQARSTAQTQEQIRAMTSQLAELRQELTGVPQLTGRVDKLEAHQADITRRVDKLEGRGG